MHHFSITRYVEDTTQVRKDSLLSLQMPLNIIVLHVFQTDMLLAVSLVSNSLNLRK